MADGGRRARVLVLGGTGFIGRNLVHYLVRNDLVAKVRVADKVPPQMAWLNDKHKGLHMHLDCHMLQGRLFWRSNLPSEPFISSQNGLPFGGTLTEESFSSPCVEFKHSNLINPASVEGAFTDSEGEFDYVINLAAETKYGQTDPVYQEGIVKLSLNCSREAAKHNLKVYIEASSSQMYSSEKPEDAEPSTPVQTQLCSKKASEDKKPDPWTYLARHKLSVEKELRDIPDLNYIIVRPAIVYGDGDRNGLTPRLIIGAIYKYIREKMKMLWTKDVKMNTVHVDDVARALWHLCLHGQIGEIYHIVDKGDTTQGTISELVSDIFSIEHDYVGSAVSSLAKWNMNNVVEQINDKHMEPWADACQRDEILNTPLNPFIDQELLYNKHLHLDGFKLEETGFVYEKPVLKMEYLQEVLENYLKTGLFPPSLLSDQQFWPKQEEDEEEEEGEEQSSP